MSEAVRRLVLLILLFGLVGTGIELLLLGHTEDGAQWIPLVLMAAALVVLAWTVARPAPGNLRMVQVLMALFIVSGVVGMVLHFQANLEFQLEVAPSTSGWPLWLKALRAKTPPALAPGVMMQLGLLGLVYTFRHPALHTK